MRQRRDFIFLYSLMQNPHNKLTGSSAEKICRDHDIVRLNLGCGYQKLEEYINIDSIERFNPDFIHDLSKPLPFPENSVHEIQAMDLFEHFDKYIRYIVMENWANILVKGGKINLQVPNMAHILSLEGKVDIESLMELIYGETMIASKAYSWHYGNHKWGYTRKSLFEFGRIFGIYFSILDVNGNIKAEGIKMQDMEFDNEKIKIYSFGNDKGVGKAYMTLSEVKDKIRKLIK